MGRAHGINDLLPTAFCLLPSRDLHIHPVPESVWDRVDDLPY
jgi:hypothetical protein